MRTGLTVVLLAASLIGVNAATITSPSTRLNVDVDVIGNRPCYSVTLDGKTMVKTSPLGFKANIGDFTRVKSMKMGDVESVTGSYAVDRIKKSDISYNANEVRVTFTTQDDKKFDVLFHVGDNDIAFRYELPKYGNTGSIYIEEEATAFSFPQETTTFLCPQSDAMIGWKRTKPSYEEEYKADAAMAEKSLYGHGYTFPCLFHVGDKGWVLVSETGVDSRYCASHLSDYKDDAYSIAFPMAEENNGNGSTGAAFSLPGVTPWRTITVGSTLKPIVETTIAWDVVKPLYETANNYKYGRSTWSWILWQDESINMSDLKQYVDLAQSMGYEYTLVDAGWDVTIGRDKMPELINYAHERGVEPFIWYSSSGYWNDIVQSPTNCMDNPIIRKKEMQWLKSIGAKGIKVDFFGGDKQETMRLYEAILSDADDNGLMVIFHGCTLPRGWERMYPNYVGSEAVLASENIYFQQHFCDEEAFNATLHPFIRNTVGCMEFGGCFMNRRMSRDNNSRNYRRTTDAFELATTVLFQNPIQNFALAPNNLKDAPEVCMNFLKTVPTTWDETVYVDGYPGKYVVLARRHGDTWYVGGVNAQKEALTLNLNLPMVKKGDKYSIIYDGKDNEPVGESRTAKTAAVKVVMPANGGFVIVK